MDGARVLVWRVRLFLLAAAVGLVGVGADRPELAPQSIERSLSSPSAQTVSALSTKVVAVQVRNGPVPRPLAEPVKQVRADVVVSRPLDLRCSGRAVKSAKAQKSNSCKVAASTGTSIKKAVSGQRKPTAASFAKKRTTSIGAATRNAESPKARQKVARKDDAKSPRNVAAVRQARTRNA